MHRLRVTVLSAGAFTYTVCTEYTCFFYHFCGFSAFVLGKNCACVTVGLQRITTFHLRGFSACILGKICLYDNRAAEYACDSVMRTDRRLRDRPQVEPFVSSCVLKQLAIISSSAFVSRCFFFYSWGSASSSPLYSSPQKSLFFRHEKFSIFRNGVSQYY
jgi:hypothetical protein